MLECDYLVIGSGNIGTKVACGLAETGKAVILASQDELEHTRWFQSEIPRDICIREARTFRDILKRIREYTQPVKGMVKYRKEIAKYISEQVDVQLERVEQELSRFDNVRYIEGQVEFISSSLVEINSSRQRHLVNAKQIIICSGKQDQSSKKFKGGSKTQLITADSAYHLKKIPNGLLIPAITPETLEIAYLYASLGIKVLMYDSRPQDEALSALDRTGINFLFRTLLANHVEFFFGLDNPTLKFSRSGIAIKVDGDEFVLSHMYVVPQWVFDGNSLGLENVHIPFTSRGVQANEHGRITGSKQMWVFGRAQDGYNPELAISQIDAYIALQKHATQTHESRERKLREKKSLYVSSPQSYNRIYIADQVIQIGMTEISAVSQYGSAMKTVSITKPGWDGIAKLVFSQNSGKVVGAVITGDFARQLEVNIAVVIEQKTNVHKFIHIFSTLYPQSTIKYV